MDVKTWWIKEHPVGRNISNQHKVYTAVDVPPQNPGWIKVVDAQAYADLVTERDNLVKFAKLTQAQK